MSVSATAQQSSKSELSGNYTFEIAPLVGKNLPYDLWGTPGTMSVIGVRGAFRLPNPHAAVESSIFYHHAGPDNAYTIDVSFRYELYSDFLNGYFNIGAHYSRYNLEPDLEADGSCVLTGCVTDSGNHSGLTYGGGVMLPLGEWPLRLGIRFYQNPQSWLLLEASYGIRF